MQKKIKEEERKGRSCTTIKLDARMALKSHILYASELLYYNE